LSDIRVLSVTVYLAGPFLSMTLARFGAEVIKVEMPGSGDPIRNIGPFAGPRGLAPDRQTEEDLSVRFLKRGEGLKSVTLNLKEPEGRALFLELAKRSDVIVENLSPGSMERLGLGYREVAERNPGIVYCSIAGYGQSGPYKDQPAHDHQIQAMSGLMDMNGDPDGPPTRVGVFVGDLVTPLYAAYSILGALRIRERTGIGQHLDASMIDTLATLMFMEPMEFMVREGLPPRAGNGSRNDVTGLYRLRDGDVIVTAGSAERWRKLCEALGLESLRDDPRFATAAGREAHVEELKHSVQDALAPLDCAAAIERLENAGVPAARVRTLTEAMSDPHFRERGTLRPMYRYGSAEPVPHGLMAGFPVLFSGGRLPALEGGAPLGHHNQEVFGRLLGLDDESVAALRDRGVI